ncbi:TrkH family potassium uptake protein [Flexithrix dorotheae]|uniref:TrkH family potassium uptake protein n=1 Tax=Flexithrix dorotheae TaxID=70993 RepID=UPI0003797353|nr:potassium transporter TrkG [Flexithrix dorotheae]
MRFNFKIIVSIVGLLLIINGLFMILCLPFSIYFNEGDWKALLVSGLLTYAVGFTTWFRYKDSKEKELKKKDGYLIVTLGWVVMSAFGALPFLFSGAIPNYTDAFFETISGFSTTGASILTDIESVPKGILFWRSLTQWIGGMGIIVLTVAILPLLGIGGMQLFVAEAPGISPDKLKPRIQATAKRLWYVYVSLTILETVLLMLGGMSFYDAINHSLTTMATGGFSTKNSSAAEFSPYIQYVLIFFMFMAGTSFTLNYFLFKGKLRNIWKNEEFRYYGVITLVFSALAAITLYFTTDKGTEEVIREALFQVVSVITTTGYASADYLQWSPFLIFMILILMFIGGSAGSTSGGVKIVRHVILLKNSLLELKRQLHPSAILPVRFNGKAVAQNITYHVLAFIFIYLSIFAIGTFVIAATGMDFESSIGAVATSLGNIGPGLGTVGPVSNFADIPMVSKWILAFLMLLGRLELFTVLMLFTPFFWKKV